APRRQQPSTDSNVSSTFFTVCVLVHQFVNPGAVIARALVSSWGTHACVGDHVSTSSSSNPNSTPGPSSQLRVLVVDDQDAVLAAIAGLLTARGFDSVMAASGEEALQRLRTEYFDVMVCDVRMPGMSGLQILTEALTIE